MTFVYRLRVVAIEGGWSWRVLNGDVLIAEASEIYETSGAAARAGKVAWMGLEA